MGEGGGEGIWGGRRDGNLMGDGLGGMCGEGYQDMGIGDTMDGMLESGDEVQVDYEISRGWGWVAFK